MKIDRNNYEEFFLLYTDNELSAAERSQVELFVQQNPDLQEEFTMLQQSRLVADSSIIFDLKNTLYRSEESDIPQNEIEEKILLYTDNELTPGEKAALESAAGNDPELKKQLDLYLLTRAVADESVVFPYKESLYRKEETAKVIAFSWRRVAVAAVLLLTFGTATIYMLTRQGSTGNPTTSGEIAGTQQVKTDAQPNPATGDQASPLNNKEENNSPVPGNRPDNNTARYVADNTADKTKPAKDKFINNSIQKYNEENNPAQDPPYASLNPSDLSENRNKITSPVSPIAANVNTDPSTNPRSNDFNNSDVTPAALATYYPAEDDGNKKSRGLFRKVTRILEHNSIVNNATTDDNKLLIGSFAVSLK